MSENERLCDIMSWNAKAVRLLVGAWPQTVVLETKVLVGGSHEVAGVAGDRWKGERRLCFPIEQLAPKSEHPVGQDASRTAWIRDLPCQRRGSRNDTKVRGRRRRAITPVAGRWRCSTSCAGRACGRAGVGSSPSRDAGCVESSEREAHVGTREKVIYRVGLGVGADLDIQAAWRHAIDDLESVLVV